MGWGIGLPSLKLNNAGTKSKHCGSFAAVAAEGLEERQGHDRDIDVTRSHLNIYDGFRTAAELQAYSQQHLEQLRDAKGRKLRADAVVMCATIIKPPAAFMNSLSDADQKRFLDDGRECLESIIGRENVKAAAYHFDEQGAHLHVFWEPMTSDGRLCAKEMHNLQFFGRVNREMPTFLRSRGWDIDDCNAYDQAAAELQTEKEKSERRRKNGRHSSVYKAEAERTKNQLDQQIDDAKEWLEQIPDWDTYDAVATHAWKLIDDYKRLQEDVFNSGWILRNRKAEKSLLKATEGLRDGIMTAISALRGYEVRERVPKQQQRSQVITRSLDQMVREAEARTSPRKALKEKSRGR